MIEIDEITKKALKEQRVKIINDLNRISHFTVDTFRQEMTDIIKKWGN